MTSADEALIESLCGDLPMQRRGMVFSQLARHPDPDKVLSQALARKPASSRTIVRMLGDITGAHGDAGVDALRLALHASGRGSSDVRGLAALALAKRCGKDSTPWLAELLAHRDPGTKEYAVIGLVGAGDDRAWEDAFDLLPRVAKYTVKSSPPFESRIISYLGQHLYVDDRAIRLVDRIRVLWSEFDEPVHEWIAQYWPEAAPTGPPPAYVPPPTAQSLRATVAGLFEKLPLRDPADSNLRLPRR